MEQNSEQGSKNVVSIADGRRMPLSAEHERSRRPRVEVMVQQFLELLKSECDPESFFHTPDGEPYAHIRVDGHFENWPLQSSGFKTWVAHAFYRMMRITPDEKTLKLLMIDVKLPSKFPEKFR